jgi:ribonuclease HII
VIEEKLLASGIAYIAGVDEAGRGACAGPLVVAAVILRDLWDPKLDDVTDSKKLTSEKRELLFTKIVDSALAYSIIEISPEEIDQKGLHCSNIEGMRRAASSLSIRPEYILTDGYAIPGLEIENLAIWKGDQVALSISSASILAKVYRDRVMNELDLKYPGYGFESHKGYATRTHEVAMEKLGVSPIHRKSYANVARHL